KREKVLILDALGDRVNPSHLTIDQAIEIGLRVCPERLILIGFSHRVDHEDVRKRLEGDSRLKEKGIIAEPGYDGMVISLV
ncbi:hypothetical protein HDU76_009658, partial [Blyttiomyces sp. JEL0837]